MSLGPSRDDALTDDIPEEEWNELPCEVQNHLMKDDRRDRRKNNRPSSRERKEKLRE